MSVCVLASGGQSVGAVSCISHCSVRHGHQVHLPDSMVDAVNAGCMAVRRATTSAGSASTVGMTATLTAWSTCTQLKDYTHTHAQPQAIRIQSTASSSTCHNSITAPPSNNPLHTHTPGQHTLPTDAITCTGCVATEDSRAGRQTEGRALMSSKCLMGPLLFSSWSSAVA